LPWPAGPRINFFRHQTYDVAAKLPLAWLLQTAPADHTIGG
jgi:hypothetical protein